MDDSLLEDADGRDNDNVVSAQEQTRETDPECCFDSAVEVTAVSCAFGVFGVFAKLTAKFVEALQWSGTKRRSGIDTYLSVFPCARN